ncbi:hypothetical protein CHS0354_035753 [Potamilus streckersoni]|uniref:Uncharacterized protein n=1 Tax=Potamilus streckersoni TaxID=2493646 RepID=A0AAE0S0G0_9BIVA|nr:hypothetical protein CHS0354_035753 [Potamilus streckersoni]
METGFSGKTQSKRLEWRLDSVARRSQDGWNGDWIQWQDTVKTAGMETGFSGKTQSRRLEWRLDSKL